MKILMNHLATFESTKDFLKLQENEYVVTAAKKSRKKGIFRRTSSSALKQITRIISFKICKPSKLRKTSTEESSNSCSSFTASEEGRVYREDPKDYTKATSIVNRILETNSILESFGNAKTTKNDNSSRFGKFIQLQFNVEKFHVSSCKLVGSYCETYLLEKSRVVSHDVDERTFHIFYQLLSAPEDVKADVWQNLVNADASSFKYVGLSNTIAIEGVSDSERFFETIGALDIIGVKGELLELLMKGLCFVLQLGNLTFEESFVEGCDGSIVSSPDDLVLLADLMGIEDDIIAEALTTANVAVQNEVFSKKVNPDIAKERCDALAKAIYNKLFEWLVSFMNDVTRAESNIVISNHDALANIGLLDIFGFESFQSNHFEQLLINHANERLQLKFSEDIFLAVQEEYEREGISISKIEFPDNSDVLRLIEGSGGLIALLNEECILPKGNDYNFVAKVYKSPNPNKIFKEKSFCPHEFGVMHFAGEIKYSANQVVVKNQDFLPTELITCALSCKNSIITDAFQSYASKTTHPMKQMSRRLSSLGSDSTWGKFKCQIDALMNKLSLSETRYVRCIKPNIYKRPRYVDMSHCLQQIRCAGIVQAVTMSRQCFPNRLSFSKFHDLFGHMVKKQENVTSRKKGMVVKWTGNYGWNNKIASKDNRKEVVEKMLRFLFEGKGMYCFIFVFMCV